MMSKKEFITLRGNISTSLNRQFILDELIINKPSSKKQLKVMFEIAWDNSCLHYQLDLGAYANEKEVLLQDGIRLEIIEIYFDKE